MIPNDMKYIFVFYIFLCISMPLQAQSDAFKGAAATANRGVGSRDDKKLPPDSLNWKKGGDVALSFTQTELSNWAAGGENSVSFSTSANLFANYKKDKMIWENYGFMAYGIIKSGKRDPVKNSDQINIGSRVGYQMAKNWYYTAALLGKTQFATGYKYTSSDTTLLRTFWRRHTCSFRSGWITSLRAVFPSVLRRLWEKPLMCVPITMWYSSRQGYRRI